jgi:hypothetical protein
MAGIGATDDFFDVPNFRPVFLSTTVFEPSRPQAVLLVEIGIDIDVASLGPLTPTVT